MKKLLCMLLAGAGVFCVVLIVYINKHFCITITYREPVLRACACNRCVVENKDDLWFTARYNTSVPTLLNSTTKQLRNDTLRWWLRLQRHKTNWTYDVVVEKLFPLFPDKKYYQDGGPDRCRTCAVVGNSANLNGSRYGHFIDAHDLVFRLNKGPTEGYEKDVGSRTTHRVIYPMSATDVGNSTHLVLLPFKVVDFQWLMGIFTGNPAPYPKKVKTTIKGNKDLVMIINPEFMRYVYENWLSKKGKYPTTGLFMIIFSLHICDQVSVFGFGADKKGRWGHYYEPKYHQYFNTGNHKGSLEYSVLQELANRNKIHVYRGW